MGKWSEKDVEKTIELLKNGKSYYDISLVINKPASSIRSKLFILGLKYKDYFFIEKKCQFCEKIFKTTNKRKKKFCNHSCATKYNNKQRGHKIYNKIKCLNCNNEISERKKFCSNKCQGDYVKKITYEKIKNGDVTLSEKSYKEYLILLHGNKCMECGWDKVNPVTGKCPIELEHIDGDSTNNKLENLCLLCPNCHSLTPTYKALNKGNGRHKRRMRYNEGKSY